MDRKARVKTPFLIFCHTMFHPCFQIPLHATQKITNELREEFHSSEIRGTWWWALAPAKLGGSLGVQNSLCMSETLMMCEKYSLLLIQGPISRIFY